MRPPSFSLNRACSPHQTAGLAVAAFAVAALTASDAFAQGNYSRIARRDSSVTPAGADSSFRERSFDTYDYDTTTKPTLSQNLDPRKVATAVQGFSREMQALYAVLRQEERNIPSVRTYLAEVNGYQIDADLLARDLQNARNVAQYEVQLRELDSGWNRTSRRLASIPGLSRTASQAIVTVDSATKNVESTLQIGGPSLDRRALVETAVLLRSAVQYLSNTIEFSSAITSDTERRSLRLSCNQARQQADRLYGLVFDSPRPDRDYLISEYRSFTRLMNPVINKLRGNPDQAFDRDVRTVQDYQRKFSDLLLIDRTIDRDEIGYMVADLQRDVKRFFDHTTLELLRDIPRNNEALSAGNAFWSSFENFSATMSSSQEPADWSFAYQAIDTEWRDFEAIFREINSEQARSDLKEIEAGMNALRESLNLTTSFDRSAVAEKAALIETRAASIQRDAESWIRQSRPSYSRTALADLVDYELSARDFHAAVINGRPKRELMQMETELFELWKMVYGHIKQCDTPERAYLAASARDTTPAFRALQVALTK
ncbi:MAG: hypothetical protein AAF907_02290 [Planctomycetota bacterium]